MDSNARKAARLRGEMKSRGQAKLPHSVSHVAPKTVQHGPNFCVSKERRERRDVERAALARDIRDVNAQPSLDALQRAASWRWPSERISKVP